MIKISKVFSSLFGERLQKYFTQRLIYYWLCLLAGVCTNGTAPSVSSINRILRNRAAERAAAEFARAAGYGLYQVSHPYASFPWPPVPHGLWPGSGAVAADSPNSVTVVAAAAAGLQHHGSAGGVSNKLSVPLQMINVHQSCGVMPPKDLIPRLLGKTTIIFIFNLLCCNL